MKTRFRLVALTVVLVLAATGLAIAVTVGMRRGTAVAATVNGEVIYASALSGEVTAIALQYGIDVKSKEGEKQRGEITRVVLDQMIEQRLILQKARQVNALATDAQIDAQLAEIKRNFSSEADFQGALAQRGLTVNALRDRLRTNLTVQNLVGKVTSVSVTDAEVERYFRQHRREYDQPEQVRASHILLESDAEARFVLARLRRGDKFEDLARQYSKDPGSKEQSGDLGFVSRGQLVGEFEKAAFTLRPWQVSGIVKTQFGYHLIKVTGRKDPQPANLAQVRDQIRAQLLSKKREAAFQAWLKRIKAQAKIKRFDRATK